MPVHGVAVLWFRVKVSDSDDSFFFPPSGSDWGSQVLFLYIVGDSLDMLPKAI